MVECLPGSHMFFENMFHFLCNGGTWFITCFILCYFVFPLLLGIFRELTAKTKVRIFCVITLFLVYAPVYTHMMKIPSIYSNPTFRMMEFALGVIIALMKKEGVVLKLTERQKKMSIYFGFVLLVLVANAFGIIGIESFDNYSFYDCIAIPIFSIILFMGGTSSKKLLVLASARAYDFFLVSFFTFPIVIKIVGLEGIMQFRIVLSFVINCLLTEIFYQVVDERIIKLLKNKWS